MLNEKIGISHFVSLEDRLLSDSRIAREVTASVKASFKTGKCRFQTRSLLEQESSTPQRRQYLAATTGIFREHVFSVAFTLFHQSFLQQLLFSVPKHRKPSKMTTSITAVAITQLVVYIILLPLIIYLLYAHGKRGLLAYIYLFIFCVMQLIAGGLQVSHSNPIDNTAAILSAVGFSPLLLSLAGSVHEAHQYLSPQKPEKAKLGWALQLILHLVTIAAIVLLAIGSSDLNKAIGTHNYHHDLVLRRTGSILLLVTFLAITAHASWVFLNHHSSTNKVAKTLLYGTLVALPFIYSRLFYTIVYSFASFSSHTFRTLSPNSAPTAIRVIFILLLPLFGGLSLIVGGLLSRKLARSRQEQGPPGYEPQEQMQQGFENDQTS